MRNYWDRLTRMQKHFVSAAIVLAAAALAVQFALFPLYDAKKKMENSLAANRKVVKAMEPLGREYLKWKQAADAVQAITAQRAADFTLFTYIERKAAEAGVRTAVRYINPLKSSQVGAIEESAVEMKLEKITLKQLTRFLYLVESPQELITVRKAAINKAKENPEYLNAVLQVATYRRAEEGRPPGR